MSHALWLLAGTLCIAPFRVDSAKVGGPNMSTTTWAPGEGSVYEFRIDNKLAATVRVGETIAIPDVPADRRVMVGVRLDGRPYESFRVDLRKEPEQRACFWLYEGYWHWVNAGWDESKGCSCADTCKTTAKYGKHTVTLADAQRIQAAARKYLAKESFPMPSGATIDCEGVVRMRQWILADGGTHDDELRLTLRVAESKAGRLLQELRMKKVGNEWQVLGSGEVIYHLR